MGVPIWVVTMLILLPSLLILLMSQSRDQQTFAFAVSAIVISFAILGIVFFSGDPYSVLFGYILGLVIALLGIGYRENRVIRDFEEPERIPRPLKKSSAGFWGSFLLRTFQFLPIEAWILYTLSSNSITLIIAILMVVILEYKKWLLTKIESGRWAELIENQYSSLDY